MSSFSGEDHYFPDYIAEQMLETGETINWIIETKGFEDNNVPLKDAESENWCKKATEFTNQTWKFMKVPDKFFRGTRQVFSNFQDMKIKLDNFGKVSVNQTLF